MFERLIAWDSGRVLQEHTSSIEKSKESERQFTAFVQFLLSQHQELKRELETERSARQTELRHERELREQGLQKERDERAK